MERMRSKVVGILFIVAGVTIYTGYQFYRAFEINEKNELKNRLQKVVKSRVTQSIVHDGKFIKNIDFEEKVYNLSYTIDESIQKGLEKILKRYPSDHTSVVILDNTSGAIVAAAAVKKATRSINYSLPFSSTHPSASIFKVVTSADLIENSGLFVDKEFHFRGRGSTLYRYQLNNKRNRWTRKMSFKKAFAFSNNVIFGKAAIQETSGMSIYNMASRFGFNKNLMNDVHLGVSKFEMPQSQYNLAEYASGLNRKTLMSPVHAALISSIVANDGLLKQPYLLKKINEEQSESNLINKGQEKRVLQAQTAREIQKMMTAAVELGTARRIKNGYIGRKLMDYFSIGAKTGSITGGIPFGKRDWLTLFAKPKDKSHRGYSVAIMNVNIKRWYYKSTFVAQKVLDLIRKSKLEKLEESKIAKNSNFNDYKI